MYKLHILILCVILNCTFYMCIPVSKQVAVKYLQKYGYANASLSITNVENSLKQFQRLFSLPETGQLDAETLNLMSRPRCGKPDRQFARVFWTRNWFRPTSQKWRKSYVTYKLRNYPKNGLSKQITLKEITRAFNVWERYIPIKFVHKYEGKADIEITFNPSNLGDGPGNTLAYAYFPPKGSAYFDAENWSAYSYRGVNLFVVAAHEFGHSLGLEHSYVRGSLMYPYVDPKYNPRFRLHQNDVSRIQGLYGSRK